jgi:DNA repair exonuclease SbcCD ATPase subunit
VRRRVLQDQHVTELNRALRRVLSRFALHYSLRRSIEMRPDPTKGIEYHVPDLETSSDARTERSFSTGQLNALAISLAIALNLNRHGHPFGFMCFDDVSSAFDLDNLACDAAVIRALAYGPDPARRRQVILATHHDELTTRLLPLLRPPRGHRLKVVQFTDWSRSAGAQVEQWECVAGEGDPEQVVRLLRSGGAT